MTRPFHAPRRLVFEAMSKPEHVTEWWGRLGEGCSVPVCEIDLRVGGRWRFVNRHPKGEAAFHGEYCEIASPGRIVFTEIFEDFPDTVSVVTSELTEEDGKTRLNVTVRYPSMQVRDMVIQSGMACGAGISYDRLEDLVAELQQRETNEKWRAISRGPVVHRGGVRFQLALDHRRHRMDGWSIGSLSCMSGGAVIHFYYEDPYGTAARVTGCRDRSGIAGPPVFKVRYCARAFAARRFIHAEGFRTP
jgi:uncharacterized protein YndB with AHSA1/START domain